MKFEKVRAGEYRSQLNRGVYVWVFREGAKWFWCLGGYDEMNGGAWETDNNGPFSTRREAIADAIANYTL